LMGTFLNGFYLLGSQPVDATSKCPVWLRIVRQLRT
jgi:hypothetical protein